jgi:hypothetical protein
MTLEPTAARRSDLHLAIDAGWRADDTLRFGEFLTQMFGTAADRWRLTFDIGRAFGALLGRRPAVLDRLRRGGCREGEAHEYGRDQGAQAISPDLRRKLNLNANASVAPTVETTLRSALQFLGVRPLVCRLLHRALNARMEARTVQASLCAVTTYGGCRRCWLIAHLPSRVHARSGRFNAGDGIKRRTV